MLNLRIDQLMFKKKLKTSEIMLFHHQIFMMLKLKIRHLHLKQMFNKLT